jgi:hypothetical protein
LPLGFDKARFLVPAQNKKKEEANASTIMGKLFCEISQISLFWPILIAPNQLLPRFARAESDQTRFKVSLWQD